MFYVAWAWIGIALLWNAASLAINIADGSYGAVAVNAVFTAWLGWFVWRYRPSWPVTAHDITVPKPPATRGVTTVMGRYYGLRYFDMDHRRLTSVAVRYIYRPGWNTTSRDRIRYGLGFFLCPTLRDLQRAWRCGGTLGVVEARGLIAEHEHGARAQEVRIVAVRTLQPGIGRYYKAPTFRTTAELMRYYKELRRDAFSPHAAD